MRFKINGLAEKIRIIHIILHISCVNPRDLSPTRRIMSEKCGLNLGLRTVTGWAVQGQRDADLFVNFYIGTCR